MYKESEEILAFFSLYEFFLKLIWITVFSFCRLQMTYLQLNKTREKQSTSANLQSVVDLQKIRENVRLDSLNEIVCTCKMHVKTQKHSNGTANILSF